MHIMLKDETGKRYGNLEVVSFAGVKNRSAYWLCKCDCGLTTTVTGTYLRSGHTTSCGCTKVKYFGKKHGYGDSEKLYGVWLSMKRRCDNKNSNRYKTYGGRGIKVCSEWMDYGNFRSWAYKNGYKEAEPGTSRGQTLSIDRIDPNKDYCPENCRWITVSENNRHRFECQANQNGSLGVTP